MPFSGPLSFGQISLWRDIQKLPRDRWHEVNISTVWELPEGTGTAAVKDALEALTHHHPSLRTTYDLSDPGNPVQLVHEPDSLSDLNVSEEAADDLRETARRMASQPFDLTSEFGWRGRVVTRSGTATHLVFTHHHLAADNWSQGILREEFPKALADPGSFLDRVDSYSLITMAEEQRGNPFKARRTATERHWEKVLTASAEIPQRPRPTSAERPFRVLQGAVRSTAAQTAAQQLADRLSVPKSSVLLAAYTRAVAQVCGLPSVPVRLQSSNRGTARWGSYVTSMNQWAAGCLDAVAGTGFGELAQAVNKAAFLAYRMGMYDPDSISLIKQRFPSASIDPEPVWAFNYMVRPAAGTVDPDESDVPVVTWDEQASAIGPKFHTRFIEDGSAALTIWLRGRETSKELVSELLLGIHEVLVSEARGLRHGER
ncbi:condensation domain-containing protein [Streptomyces sp. ME19-01-6]|uniref:condensation domain-containing protein n=1 Tax=Streptomyces sp. ME19-01-6 TaxID=3028686 RepID=UPI0029BE6F21|nr:condensation domain-containing protein [Streptomyces sp. ME19-01-6]MDX3229329.1 condensation domain-containing protein [Streptomyces sp. ME19-01-6]